MHSHEVCTLTRGVSHAAMKRLRDALERWPRNVRMLTSAAVLEGRRRNLDAARALFSKAHLLEPDNAVLLRTHAQQDGVIGLQQVRLAEESARRVQVAPPALQHRRRRQQGAPAGAR